MEKFFNQILDSYFPLYTQTSILNGFEVDQFNVFIDFDTALLASQLLYTDHNKEDHEIESEPNKEYFLVFYYDAFKGLQQHRKELGLSTLAGDVLNDLEKRFIKYAVPKGYNEKIRFSLASIYLNTEENLEELRKERVCPIIYNNAITQSNMRYFEEFQPVDFLEWDISINIINQYCQGKNSELNEDALKKEIREGALLEMAINQNYGDLLTSHNIDPIVQQLKVLLVPIQNPTKLLWKTTWFIQIYLERIATIIRITKNQLSTHGTALIKSIINHRFFNQIPVCILLNKRYPFGISDEKTDALQFFVTKYLIPERLHDFYSELPYGCERALEESENTLHWTNVLKQHIHTRFTIRGYISTGKRFNIENVFKSFDYDEVELIMFLILLLMSLSPESSKRETDIVSHILSKAGVPNKFLDKILKSLEVTSVTMEANLLGTPLELLLPIGDKILRN